MILMSRFAFIVRPDFLRGECLNCEPFFRVPDPLLLCFTLEPRETNITFNCLSLRGLIKSKQTDGRAFKPIATLSNNRKCF